MNNYSLNDIRSMNDSGAECLARDIRAFLIENVTLTGGHLASNLGIVEISLALLRVFDAPDDKIIYDTGHQSYVHKLLTGRLDDFATLRQYGGLSGFTKRSESEYDPFGAGHSSTSISAALGFCRAATLKGEASRAIAVIGDGAFTGGMIYEALNNIRPTDNIIIVLNDNDMSISKNVGSMSKSLGKIRTDDKYFALKERSSTALDLIPVIGKPAANLARGMKNAVKSVVMRDNMFEQLGINYLGPADGNNLHTVEAILREAKRKKGPAIIHLHTRKGKGFAPAEKNPCNYHSLSPAGNNLKREMTFSRAFGETLANLAQKDGNIVAVTAAMADGVGLCDFRRRFPKRFFDVGIAEQHAMTFSAGLAADGMLPFFAVYSTFFQRCYDQLMHDIVLQKLKAVVVLDHAGFADHDGPTHHGLFDISLTLNLPELDIYSPATVKELIRAMGEVTQRDGQGYVNKHPAVIRYAKGAENPLVAEKFPCNSDIELLCAENAEAVIVTFGRITANAVEAAELLKESGVSVSVIKISKLYPLDSDRLCKLIESSGSHRLICFLEEGMRLGGFSESVAAGAASGKYRLPAGKIIIRAVEDCFIPQGSLNELWRHSGLSPEQIAEAVRTGLDDET